MFCPKCKAEYREGFYTCADCNVDLVKELPPEKKPEFVDYEEVLFTYNPADIAMIKSILDAEGITYFVKGEHFTYVSPLADPVRLMVKKEQVVEAKSLLKELNLSYMGINLDNNPKRDEKLVYLTNLCSRLALPSAEFTRLDGQK